MGVVVEPLDFEEFFLLARRGFEQSAALLERDDFVVSAVRLQQRAMVVANTLDRSEPVSHDPGNG